MNNYQWRFERTSHGQPKLIRYMESGAIWESLSNPGALEGGLFRGFGVGMGGDYGNL